MPAEVAVAAENARSMLVEAAWVISGVPGPLRAFFIRVRDKRGKHVAAVATARKLAVIVWHMLTKDEDYIWSRSALLDWKLRKLELTAGHPSHRGGRAKGSAADYSNKSVRDSERETIGNAFMRQFPPPSDDAPNFCLRAECPPCGAPADRCRDGSGSLCRRAAGAPDRR
jgi:hypothetical protein